MAGTASDQRQIWHSFSRALDAELREAQFIPGASGLEHPVQAISVDDKGKRVIVFSSETNARTAALIQGDIQQTMPDVSILVARPVIADLSVLVRRIFPTP